MLLELLIGIPLTITAWKRGWKGWAVLPLPLALVVQFVIGLILGATAPAGTTVDDLAGTAIAVALVIDLLAAAVLVGMIVKPRRSASEPVGFKPSREQALGDADLHKVGQ
jgi:hypothetical protein